MFLSLASVGGLTSFSASWNSGESPSGGPRAKRAASPPLFLLHVARQGDKNALASQQRYQVSPAFPMKSPVHFVSSGFILDLAGVGVQGVDSFSSRFRPGISHKIKKRIKLPAQHAAPQGQTFLPGNTGGKSYPLPSA